MRVQMKQIFGYCKHNLLEENICEEEEEWRMAENC
jgi:hypothetical protein